MRFFILLGLFISNLASANAWISVEPDHSNLFYREGDNAKILVRALNEPTKNGYYLKVTVEHLGQGLPVEIPLAKGVALYTTPALVAGVESFRFVTHLVGPATPPDAPFDQVMQDEILELFVK